MRHPEKRKPGEMAFAIFLALASLYLFYNAFGISGFTALSGAGAIPMATTFAMGVAAIITLWRTARLPVDPAMTFKSDILPIRVAVIAAFLILYAIALKPIGFLPTSAVFLIASIKYLGRRSWMFSIGIGLFSLFAIYLVFRIVFTVLMPAGIVPEGEMLAFIRNLFAGKP